MNYIKKIVAWWHAFFRKRRFSMLNATDNSEEWHIHLSPASIFTALVAFGLLFFILVLTLMAYTPVLEFLPGYRTEADRSRESLIQNIIRLDSMERMMNDMMTYNENIALILEGHTPVARSLPSADSTRTNKILVVPSSEDSLLRVQMGGNGEYAILGRSGSTTRQLREAMQLTKPAEGIITEHFDIAAGHFGVRLATAAGDRITAVDKGSVLQSLWTPENGIVILIQHADNHISIYKNLSQSLVTVGQTVRGGDQIGYSSVNDANSGTTTLFIFEWWSNGKPVDPESYIVI